MSDVSNTPSSPKRADFVWLLPQYEIRFFPGESRRMSEQVTLRCAGYEEVAQIVPVLLRSGYGTFHIEHVSVPGEPDLPEKVEHNV